MMANVKIAIDITEIDRISIGVRLYDMFNMSNKFNKIKDDNGQLYISENDIKEMFKLINPMAAELDRDLVVYRK